MKFVNVNRSAGFLAVIGLLVFGIIFAELYWITAEKKAGEKLSNQNLVQRQANERLRAEIQGLKASQAKISAMFVRLNDAVFNARSSKTGRGQINARLNVQQLDFEGGPAAIRLLTDAGVVVQPGKPANGEASVVFEAGSSRLELERLIPLLAEEENSNAFLYFDRLFLSRPATTQPFSIDPTYLDARFSVRILSAK